MKEYKVSPEWKKSIYDRNTYISDDKTICFDTESSWRWGHTYVELTDEDITHIEDDEYFDCDDYEGAYDNLELDDECSFQIEVDRGTIDDLMKLYTEEEQSELALEFIDENIEGLQEALDYLYERDGWDLFEKFNMVSSNTTFTGGIILEEVK